MNPFWVTGQGHRGQMCQNRFRSITGECLDQPSLYLVHSSIQVTNSRNEFLLFTLYICATYFELTYPVVQNICDKKSLRGHNVLQTSLVQLAVCLNSLIV